MESVSVLVILVRWRLLEEGTEGRAHGATLQGLLHTEIVHHALLNLLLGRGEQKASEDSQLGGGQKTERTYLKHFQMQVFFFLIVPCDWWAIR